MGFYNLSAGAVVAVLSYEYGRQVEWVKRAYASGAEAGFDEYGNWHCWRDIGEPENGEFLSLSIIPGFPTCRF